MTRRRVPWVVLLLTAAAADGRADCQLTGTVTAGELPLPDAAVVMARDGAELGRTTTRADGTYTLTYPEFPARLAAARVTVDAPGFTTDERLLFRRDRCLETTTNDVALEREAGAPDDQSALGQTIFVSPYTIYGSSGSDLEARFNRDLPDIVHHKILAYQSALEDLPPLGIDIGVEVLDERLTPRQAEHIRRLGRQLNAMGVVAGSGDLGGEAADAGEIVMTSVFRTIPSYGDLGSDVRPITDRLPAGEASPSRVAEGLHDVWGKQAMIAYVLQRLAAHQGTWPAGELDRLRALVRSVHATMAPDDRLLDMVVELRRVLDEQVEP